VTKGAITKRAIREHWQARLAQAEADARSRSDAKLVDTIEEMNARHLKIVQAEVTTAGPLPAEDAARLQQRLGSLIGRTVTLTTRVDPALIGGMVTRIGSTVYDGSVATQLAALRQRLAESR